MSPTLTIKCLPPGRAGSGKAVVKREPATAEFGQPGVDPGAGIDSVGNTVAALLLVPVVGFGFGLIGWPIWLGGLIGLTGAMTLATFLNRKTPK